MWELSSTAGRARPERRSEGDGCCCCDRMLAIVCVPSLLRTTARYQIRLLGPRFLPAWYRVMTEISGTRSGFGPMGAKLHMRSSGRGTPHGLGVAVAAERGRAVRVGARERQIYSMYRITMSNCNNLTASTQTRPDKESKSETECHHSEKSQKSERVAY